MAQFIRRNGKEIWKLFKAEKSNLYLYDANSSNLWTRRGSGAGLTMIPPGQSLAHTVVLTGKVLNILWDSGFNGKPVVREDLRMLLMQMEPLQRFVMMAGT